MRRAKAQTGFQKHHILRESQVKKVNSRSEEIFFGTSYHSGRQLAPTQKVIIIFQNLKLLSSGRKFYAYFDILWTLNWSKQ